MKKIVLLTFFIGNILTSFAQLTEQWHRDYFKPNISVQLTKEPIIVDSVGNSYVVGNHIMSIEGIFFRKYNSDGIIQWNKQFPDSQFMLGYNLSSMKFDKNGNILISSTFCDPTKMYLACYDTNGNLLWKKNYRRANFALPIYDFKFDDAGNIYIPSYSGGLAQGDSGLVLIKTNSLGDTLFTTKVFGTSVYWPPNLSVDSLKNVLVNYGGYSSGNIFYSFIYKFDSLGTLVYTDTIAIGNTPGLIFFQSKLDYSGNAIVCANGNGMAAQLRKYDSQGNILWTNMNGVSGYSIEVDENNNIYSAGYLNDYFAIRKLNSQGAILWTYIYPATNHGIEIVNSIKIAKDGSIFAIGSQTYNFVQSSSIILVHLSKDGQYINSNIRKETNYGTTYACFDIDYYNNVYVVGERLPHAGFTSYLYNYKLCNSECNSNINGIRYNDQNLDCAYNVAETKLAQQLLVLHPGDIFATTDSSGNYSLNCDTGSYSLQPILPRYTSVTCGQDSINFSISSSNYFANLDFGTYTLPNVTDLQLSLGIQNQARPGFTNIQSIAYTNIGTIPAYNSLLSYQLDTAFSVVSINPLPDSISGNTFMWHIPSLLVNEIKTINLETMVDITTPLSYNYHCIANIQPILSDTIPQNNSDIVSGFITGSFDPNTKTLGTTMHNPFNPFSPIENEIAYQINFQNTGNDTAFFIQIIDSISPSLDISTFRVGASSHSFSWSITGPRLLKFLFTNILLPDSNTNESASHGFVKFYIRPKINLAASSSIKNAAEIYFDYNVAVNTNAVYYPNDLVTTVIKNKQYADNSMLKIMPNPAGSALFLEYSSNLKLTEICITDIHGKIIFLEKNTSREHSIDIEKVENGFYFIKCIFDDGSSLANKFVVLH